jgi:biotin carboxyl carrier protein
MKYAVTAAGRTWRVEIEGQAPRYVVHIDGRRFDVDAMRLGDDSLLTLLLDHESVLAHTRAADARRGLYDVAIGGKYRRLEVLDALALASRTATAEKTAGRTVLEAPMPGLVVAVHVKAGDVVQVGQPLVVMEAMKMQNELLAEAAGTVREVHATVGTAVESGVELVVLEAT